MPTLSTMQLPPPENSSEFEDLCRDLWEKLWHDPSTQKVGRRGQSQHGVDIYGRPNCGSEYAGVQCKCVDTTTKQRLTESILRAEIEKAKTFTPTLSEFILATTGPRDVTLQKVARIITLTHSQNGLFSVVVWSWEDIRKKLIEHDDLLKKHYGSHFSGTNSEPSIDELRNLVRDGVKTSHELLAELRTPKTHSSLLTADSPTGLHSEYLIELNEIKQLLDQFNTEKALDAVRRLKLRAWDFATPILRYKLLSLEGGALFQLRKELEAAHLFIEARQYNPADEKAIANTAIAYAVLGNRREASESLEELRKRNPGNPYTHILTVELAESSLPLSSIVEKIPEEFRALPEVAYAIGLKAFSLEQYEGAEEWLSLACRGDKKGNPFYRGALGDVIVKQFTSVPRFSVPGEISSPMKDKMLVAVDCLTRAWEGVDQTDLKYRQVSWLINRSIARRLLGDHEKADDDLVIANSVAPGDPYVRRHLGLRAYERNEFDVALDIFGQLEGLPEVPEAATVMADCLRGLGRIPEAIALLEKQLDDVEDGVHSRNASSLLVNLYLAQGEAEKAASIVESLKAAYPDSLEPLILSAQVSKQSGRRDDAASILKQAIQIANNQSEFFDLLKLADELFSLELYDDASSIYLRLSKVVKNDEITKRMLYSLYRSGSLKQALELSRAIRVECGPVRYSIEIESYVYERIGDLDKAAGVCRDYLSTHPEDHGIRLRLCSIELRAGKSSEIDGSLAVIDPDSLPISGRLLLLSLFMRRGQISKALHLAYNTRRNFYNEADAHLQYIQLLFTLGSGQAELQARDTVAQDTVAYLRLESGVPDYYIIDDREDADPQKREFNSDHPIAKKLIGRKKGELVDLTQNPIQAQCQPIVEIKSKYLHALHESLEQYSKLFPDHGGLFKFTIDPGGTSEETREKLVSILSRTQPEQNWMKQIEDHYRQGRITLGVISNLVGRDILEVYLSFIYREDIGIICSRGTQEERNKAVSLLSPSTKLVLDPISLFSLHALDIGDILVGHFGRPGVTRSTVDLLTDLVSMRSITSGRESMTIGLRNGELWKQEISREDSEKGIQSLCRLLEWTRSVCDVLPCNELLREGSSIRNEIAESVGRPFHESILLAKEIGAVLYSEDLCLRDLARREHGLEGVWTQVVLQYLLSKGWIDEVLYNSKVISLVSWHYYHTSIDGATLIDAARRSDWYPGSPFAEVAKVLSGDRSDPSAFLVATNFLFELWNEPVMPRNRDYIVVALLEAITSKRDRSKSLAVLRKLISDRFRLWPTAGDAILSIIHHWEKSRSIIV